MAASAVIRGLDVGVRRQVSAKLCELGLSEDDAACLAESQLTVAIEFFEDCLATHQRSGKPLELAIEDSFNDLTRWAADLYAMQFGETQP